MNYRDFFKGKKITFMGLGLLGRGLGDAIFLAECGADLIVTDLKDEKALAPSLAKLKQYKNIKYTLGQHRLEDFSAKDGQAPPDFILKAAGVPLDSPFIAEARKNGVPIEMDASLFAKLAPKGVKIIGVTGTRGKTTTTTLIYEILKKFLEVRPQNSKRGLTSKTQVFLGGNIKDMATLPLLKEVKGGDYVVMELDSWQLQGFGEAKIYPDIAVFTTFYPDHMNYYGGSMEKYFADKASIFRFKIYDSRFKNGEKKKENILIAGEQVLPFIKKYYPKHTNRVIVARAVEVSKDWKVKIPGEHNLQNIACAMKAARALKIPEEIIKEVVENFETVPGRLQFLREVKGVKIYNDTNATTPDATVAGLRALGCEKLKNIILIIGGTDKVLGKHSVLINEIPKWCKAVLLLKESGTEKIKPNIMKYAPTITVAEQETLAECVEFAMNMAKKGDIVLFSPAFASFGKWFKNEYDRGEQFVRIANSL